MAAVPGVAYCSPVRMAIARKNPVILCGDRHPASSVAFSSGLAIR
ncbi:hypothetical protein [Oscillatoria acuminata]|nr:hypothetical protein [Oscillatoria acuminata]